MYRAPPSGTNLNWRRNGERIFLHEAEQNLSLRSAPRRVVHGAAALRGGKTPLCNYSGRLKLFSTSKRICRAQISQARCTPRTKERPEPFKPLLLRPVLACPRCRPRAGASQASGCPAQPQQQHPQPKGAQCMGT